MDSRPRNLLALRPVAAVARSRFYPAVLQWVVTAVFALIVWQLLLGPESAHDNLGTALTWVIWWPLLPVLFLLLGRFWCAVCPFGWLSDQAQKLVGVRRRAPRFLKRYGIWIIDAFFILITWADHVFGIVESPSGSGILLLLTITAVVASGAFFERRTFCRYLCYLGGLAGNYSRAGVVALRADETICATCSARAACFNGTPTSAACPLFEFPRTMDSSANCNFCASCVKSCPNDAITLELRAPTRELWSVRKPKVAESFLALAIMGIVLIQNLTMLDLWARLTTWIEGTTGLTSETAVFTLAFAVAVSSPVGLLALAAAVGARVSAGTFGQHFASFGYALIALDIAAHLAHNLFHLLAEGKSVAYTAAALFGRTAAEGGSAALAGPGTIQALQWTLVALGTVGSFYTAYRIARSRTRPGATVLPMVAPYAVLVVAFALLNIWLFAQPMAHRM